MYLGKLGANRTNPIWRGTACDRRRCRDSRFVVGCNACDQERRRIAGGGGDKGRSSRSPHDLAMGPRRGHCFREENRASAGRSRSGRSRGFGAEIVAYILDKVGSNVLKVGRRLAAPRIPIPFSPPLEAEVRLSPRKGSECHKRAGSCVEARIIVQYCAKGQLCYRITACRGYLRPVPAVEQLAPFNMDHNSALW